MKCPKCGAMLDSKAKKCSHCGEDLEQYSIDQLIENILNEDKNEEEPSREKGRGEEEEQHYNMGVLITKGLMMISLLLLTLSMFLPWFSFTGEGFVKGYIQQSEEIVEDSVSFSAMELRQYGNRYKDEYRYIYQGTEEQQQHVSVQTQLYFLQGFWLMIGLATLSILVLIVDKKIKYIEWIRGFSAISMLIIGLVYGTFKIPFLSMFAIHARDNFRGEDMFNAVRMSFRGIAVNNQFYDYVLIERGGFYMAAIVCGLWFVFATILIEMREGKEEKHEKINKKN